MTQISVLLIPLAYTIVSFITHSGHSICVRSQFFQGVRYNITNEAWIGACFLPCGLGNISTSTILFSRMYKHNSDDKYHQLAPHFPAFTQIVSLSSGVSVVVGFGSRRTDSEPLCLEQSLLFLVLCFLQVLPRTSWMEHRD